MPVFTETSDISAHNELEIVFGDCSLTWNEISLQEAILVSLLSFV